MKRVFHIDQQCFVIFLEDFSNEKDRFLRIGNSPFFKEFGNNFTFLDLITKTLPPDPFLELEIFKPDVDKVIIGLKEPADNYLLFLKNNGIDISNLETIYAEIESKFVVSHLKENEFLNEIKDKNIKNHSFASFYNNGNIRIFNLKNIIFDLHKYVSDEILIKDEINNLTSFYSNQYEDVYYKSGIIHSNKSLFIFSNNKFICISFDTNIIKDAIRIGINPFDIDLFVVPNDIIKDVLFYNLINQPREEGKNIRVIVKNKTDIWEHLYKKEQLELYELSEEFSAKLDNISLKTKNNKILLKYSNYVFLINSKNSLKKNDKIIGYLKKDNIENKFNLCIDAISKDSITLYSYNPLILADELEYTDYINNFWSNFNEKQKINFNSEIKGNDNNYSPDYVPPLSNSDNFYDKLFSETVRRIIIENNKVSDEVYLKYEHLVKSLNGTLINKNNLLIEQILAFENNKIATRDIIINNDFTYLDDEVNPFNIFKKDLTNMEWMDIQKKYRTYYKKEIEDKSKINMISNRFDEIIESKKFYIEEQERLKRFISQVVISATRENRTNSKYNNKTLLNELAQMNKDKNNNISSTISGISSKTQRERKSPLKLLFILIPIILLLLGLIAAGIFFRPQIFTFINDNIFKFEQQDKYHITQEDYIKKNIDKYNPKHDQVTLKSEKYKFYATVLDIYNLTNEVAVKNGYEKITPWYRKKYLKGKDPDWIYPENIIIMPDDTKLTVKDGDSMWAISSVYLVNEINNHEEQIFDIIEKTKRKKMKMKDAKIQLEKIKTESHSQMLRDVLTTLLKLDNFKNWEPEI